jgi:hypothetical protein
VPVIVTVELPFVADALALKASTLEPVAGFVPNAAVTPLGKPDAARVTLPVNPLDGVTVIVSLPVAPCPTVKLDAEGDSVKLCEPASTVITKVWVLAHPLGFV